MEFSHNKMKFNDRELDLAMLKPMDNHNLWEEKETRI